MKKRKFLISGIGVFLLLGGGGFYLYNQVQTPQNCRQFINELPPVFSDFKSSVNLTFKALTHTHNCIEKRNVSLLHSSELQAKYLSAVQKTNLFLTNMHQQNIFCDLSCGTAAKVDIASDTLMFEELAQKILQSHKPYRYHTKFASSCSVNFSVNQIEKCLKEKILLSLQKNIKPDNFDETQNSFNTVILYWQNFYSEVLPETDIPEQMQSIYTLIWVALNDMVKRHNI